MAEALLAWIQNWQCNIIHFYKAITFTPVFRLLLVICINNDRVLFNTNIETLLGNNRGVTAARFYHTMRKRQHKTKEIAFFKVHSHYAFACTFA